MDQKAVGIAVSIPLGSEDAVNMLRAQIEFLASSPKLHRAAGRPGHVLSAPEHWSRSCLASYIGAACRNTWHGRTVGSASQKIGTRSVLPANKPALSEAEIDNIVALLNILTDKNAAGLHPFHQSPLPKICGNRNVPAETMA